jgi:hypothetical protein
LSDRSEIKGLAARLAGVEGVANPKKIAGLRWQTGLTARIERKSNFGELANQRSKVAAGEVKQQKK